MARVGRIVVPGYPHHVTQRGNRRQTVFFDSSGYALYRDLLAECCRKASVEVWAYCLMPNHVHFVLTPQTAEGFARAVRDTNRQCTGFVNACSRWTGHRSHRDGKRIASASLALRSAEGAGRPLGSADFVADLERPVGQRLRRRRPGRKPEERVDQLELGIDD
jgi:REP element-mobilizing transposase RayT